MKIYKIALNVLKKVKKLDLEKLQEAYFKGWEAKVQHKLGERMVINPEIRNSIIGRAFLLGWNDSALGKPKQVPSDLEEQSRSDLWINIE